MDKEQNTRFSEAEKELIKITFKNEQVLYALRNLFWQLELTEEEKKLLTFNADALRIIKKVISPVIERDIPFTLQDDGIDHSLFQNLLMMTSEGAAIMLEADDIRERYLEQQFDKIVSKKFENEAGDIILQELKRPLGIDQREIRHVNMIAYNSLKGIIDQKILVLRFYANPPKKETPEEQKKRQEKNSSK